MFLIFEGMDKVGKTALIHEVDKLTDYRHIMVDRGPMSYLAYNDIYKRNRRTEYEALRANLDTLDCLVVYLYASLEVIALRLSQASESLPNVQGSIEQVKKAMEDEYFQLKCRKIAIDTGLGSLKSNARLILAEIVHCSKGYIKLVSHRSVVQNEKYVEYEPSFNVYTKDSLRKLHEQAPFNKSVDAPYYNMLESELDLIQHKYKKGLINHRQCVFTDNDCVSMVQIIGRPTRQKYDFIIHQRSSDISKHGVNDLLFFYDYAFDRGMNIRNIYYNVAIPHRYS